MIILANFTASINILLNELSITDTSSAAYNSQSILKRELVFEEPDGSTITYDFPIILGVADVFIYPIAADMVVAVTMNLTPLEELEFSDYTQTTNLLIVNRYYARLNALRKDTYMNSYQNQESRDFLKTLHKLQLVDGFYQVAVDLISNDLLGAEQAIEYGKDILDNYSCD